MYDYHDLSKESVTDRCSPTKKCPCRQWAECHKYVDIETRQNKLKRKRNKSKTLSNIEEYYSTYFKVDGDFHDLYCPN